MKKPQKDEPGRYKVYSCPCCETCRFDLKFNRCVQGGPYKGYVNVGETSDHLVETGDAVIND